MKANGQTMKRKILSLLLLVSMILSLLVFLPSCQPTDPSDHDNPPEHPYEPENPDNPDDPATAIDFIKDGTVNFQIVYDSGLDQKIMTEITAWIAAFSDLGVKVKKQDDYHPNAVMDCEILIGDSVANRPEECGVDIHTLGLRGYQIKAVGSRIVIAGGSAEATLSGMRFFAEHYFPEEGKTPVNFSVSSSLLIDKKQDDYAITSVKVAGRDISEYTIYCPEAKNNACAQTLQSYLYSYAGIWLGIGKTGTEGKFVKILSVNDAGEAGFRVRTDGDGNLLVECAYENAFADALLDFCTEKIKNAEGDVTFDGTVYEKTVSVVRYSDFGAKGDGVTDDFDAIIAAHAYANKSGQRVEADSGATYYIGGGRRTAIVMTDTDWKDAKFIIDDSQIPLEDRDYNVFSVRGSYASRRVTLPENFTLTAGQTNIGMTFDQDMMLSLSSDHHRIFIRRGGNSNSGNVQQEMILVDRSGNVDPTTPILYDYPSTMTMTAYRLDETPIRLAGGTFTTVVNTVSAIPSGGFYARGLGISRMNTTVSGVTHLLSGEPEYDENDYSKSCCPYTGFYYIAYAANVRIENCVLSAHTTYKAVWPEGSANAGNVVSQGTYDTQANHAVSVTWYGCTQGEQSITDGSKWGVMASNFCKNLTYDHCTLSRLDAHCGMWNASVLDSQIQTLSCIGGGTLTLKNVVKYGNTIVSLRTDYGSTWNGDVVIDGLEVVNTAETVTLLSGAWYAHDFGYPCHLPTNISIRNLTFRSTVSTFLLYSKNIAKTGSTTNVLNPWVMTKSITFDREYPYTVAPRNTDLFSSVRITVGEN